LGTLYPLVWTVTDMGKLSIGEPVFQFEPLQPLAIAAGLLMGVGVYQRWRRTAAGWLARNTAVPCP